MYISSRSRQLSHSSRTSISSNYSFGILPADWTDQNDDPALDIECSDAVAEGMSNNHISLELLRVIKDYLGLLGLLSPSILSAPML